MADAFARELDTVTSQLVMAASRRAAAIAARNQADAAVTEAVANLDAALIERAMRDSHVDLCTRQIDGLLDERLRSKASEPAVSA
jgi:rRNA-processing protein FCF1